MKTSKKEVQDLLKAWIAISVAFGIVLMKWQGINIFMTFLLALLTVGIGFLLHELAHKLMAQRYRCWAEFRADNNMLILAIAMSFLGFVFAAPGAVYISGYVTKDKNGKIALAGPLTNIILAIIFLPLTNFPGFFGLIADYGYRINLFLAIFNMIPFGAFDGSKIIKWNKAVYFTFVIASIALFMV